jgi:hypothetical protein
MATEEELVVLITAKDELSRQAATAKKSVTALAKEVEEARRAVEKGGDPANYEGLKAKLDEEQRAWARLTIARDKAGKELRDTQREVTQATAKMGGAWKRLQGVFKNPLFTAATIAGVALFGKRAVEAFAQAEQSQLKLVEAYRKFDAIGNVPIESIRALASELQSLTGTDDDLLAAAAGTLARFDLTGDAIERLLPLVNDFAILTGRNVVDASESIGKAFMGNARALKELGIDFTRTGDRGKDLETIMAALEAKAGGAGDAFGQTAQGGLTRAQAAFSDLQEEIGGTLVPALTAMLRVVEPAAKFFTGLPGPIKAVAIAIGVLGAAALAVGPRLAMMVTGMKAAGIEATAMKGKMAAAGSFVAGPWGVALAAGTVALTYFMMEQAEASARVDEFADSIDGVTGKLNQAGVAKVAETLMTDISAEDWQLLDQLGISVEDATAAVIGGEEAWQRFREQKSAAVSSAGIGKEKELLAILEGNVMGLRSEVDRGAEAWEVAKRAQDIASRSNERVAYTSGTVLAALQNVNPALGDYRDAMYSASDAAAAVKVANQRAAGQLERLQGALAGVGEEVARQQALRAYDQALKDFIANPSQEAAEAVATAMQGVTDSIKKPEDQAKFTRKAVDQIREAASDAGMKLNPDLDAGLSKARGAAILLETQIDRAVRARIVEITLRFNDSRTTYGGTRGDGPRHGGYTDGWISGSGGPTSDYAPIWASRGEYVLRAGAASALRAAIGDAGMWSLNHADRSMPSFLDSAVPPIVVPGGGDPALVGAGAPVINIGEINADSGIDVQAEVLWAMRRADRIRRERG